MTPKREALQRSMLGRGQTLSGFTADRVTLIDCWTEFGPADSDRPTIRDAEITKLVAKHSSLIGAVVSDVTISGIQSDSFSSFLHANEFQRVKVSGNIGALVIGARHMQPGLEEEYSRRLRDVDETGDWTLDISEAEGEIEIRGYSADRIRINTDTQGVVRRAALLDERWKVVDLEDTVFEVSIDMMLRHGWKDTILAANALGREYPAELRVLKRLRDEGIVD